MHFIDGVLLLEYFILVSLVFAGLVVLCMKSVLRACSWCLLFCV